MTSAATATSASESPKPPATRLGGLDVARGLAVVAMIQTHAYDGWASAAARATVSFKLTRLIGTLPLPMFLVLAGMSLSLRAQSLARRGHGSGEVRRDLVRNGLRVAAMGYVLNVVYGLMDGARSLDVFLRADVLHAIGFSLTILGALTVGPDGPRARVAAVLGGVTLLSCPWLSGLGAHVQGPARYLVAPILDVPSVTRMPIVPLLAWCALGVVLCGPVSAAMRTPRLLARMAALSLLAVGVGYGGMAALMARGVVPARTHPIIYLNGLDLAGRALLVTLLCVALHRPSRVGLAGVLERGLSLLGRHSMFAYAIHLPFCYGALAGAIKRRLSMAEASFFLALLYAGVVLATVALHRIQATRARKAAGSGASTHGPPAGQV